mmetsp:Transcript_64978/g.120987  ORF Transcript_64978/g.120987 Transcript_64978/m.120987 type:complete len:124 (+) Transcript_64978:1985-2356(+)
MLLEGMLEGWSHFASQVSQVLLCPVPKHQPSNPLPEAWCNLVCHPKPSLASSSAAAGIEVPTAEPADRSCQVLPWLMANSTFFRGLAGRVKEASLTYPRLPRASAAQPPHPPPTVTATKHCQP